MTSRVLCVIGTRPEAIKMAPVLAALRGVSSIEAQLAVTGQHRTLVADCLAALGVEPEYRLPPFPGGDLPALTSHVLTCVGALLDEVSPDWVVVHGDTASAFGATLGAVYRCVPVAHVEAGLRSGDPLAPFPEEHHRRAIGALASLHFAPTALARDHLLAEGVPADRIRVTGNPVIDVLVGQQERLKARRPTASVSPGPRMLVTCHRRETHGPLLDGICEAVRQLARPGRTIVWPVHPHPAVKPRVEAALSGVPGVRLVGPLSHERFLDQLYDATLVLTDSGGVQEEAAWLGRPTLVLRERTERPEVLASGVVRLVGTEPSRIVTAAQAWLADPPRASAFDALGNGAAGVAIARILASICAESASGGGAIALTSR